MNPVHSDTDSRRFLFLVSSARSEGNTELLARHAAASLPPSVTQIWLRLADLPLAPFVDLRHSADVYTAPEGNELLLLTHTLAATNIVFVAPTYWYTMPASAKLYLDYWSKWLRLADYGFKARMAHKLLSAIIVNAGESKEEDRYVQPLIDTLYYSAEFMAMRWGGALIGHANRPGDVLHDAVALAEAQSFLHDRVVPSA